MRINVHKGISLVEVVIGVAIASLVVIFISHTLTLFFNASEDAADRMYATYLAEEGIEMVRYLRDSNWHIIDTELANDTTYYLAVATSTIATTTTPEIIDGTYTRSFQIHAVARDNSDDEIVTTGGSNDDGSRMLDVFVSWGNATVTLSTLLTNIHDI